MEKLHTNGIHTSHERKEQHMDGRNTERRERELVISLTGEEARAFWELSLSRGLLPGEIVETFIKDLLAWRGLDTGSGLDEAEKAETYFEENRGLREGDRWTKWLFASERLLDFLEAIEDEAAYTDAAKDETGRLAEEFKLEAEKAHAVQEAIYHAFTEAFGRILTFTEARATAERILAHGERLEAKDE